MENQIVHLREALTSTEYQQATTPLSFPLGKAQDGTFLIADFHTLPHIVAGGQTGSGKSSFTEGTLIASLVSRNSANDLKLILVDPKWVQFVQYSDLPYLQRPIITKPDEARDAVEWLLKEMNRRLQVLESNQCDDIVTLNSSGAHHLPYILLVIDEVSDLMMIDSEFYESAFIEILQKAKATGIHLYIGTSRPSADVLTDRLLEYFDTRIAFKTASAIDSQRLIQTDQAENLGGKGEFLLYSVSNSSLTHLQAPYISDEAQVPLIESIVNASL